MIIQPKVTMYNDKNACHGDDYIVLPKTTLLKDVIQRCFEEGCYGFCRGSNTQGNGQFYIRSPNKNAELLKNKLNDYDGVSFFIVES